MQVSLKPVHFFPLAITLDRFKSLLVNWTLQSIQRSQASNFSVTQTTFFYNICSDLLEAKAFLKPIFSRSTDVQ